METKNEVWPCNLTAGFQYLKSILVKMCQQTLIFKECWEISVLKSVGEYDTRWHCINTYKILHFFCFKGAISYETHWNVWDLFTNFCSLVIVVWYLALLECMESSEKLSFMVLSATENLQLTIFYLHMIFIPEQQCLLEYKLE